MSIDTSAEAVEQLAVRLEAIAHKDQPLGRSAVSVRVVEAAATLRALAAENARLLADAQGHARDARHAESVAAAWKARVERLEAGITKAMDEIEDAGPKALKYAAQELRAALKEPRHD